jgi:hypothetical protein
MANKIQQTYAINIEASIFDVKKEPDLFPAESSMSTYSSTLNRDLSTMEKYWALDKNRAEIPLSYYRNGIVIDTSLMSKLIGNKLYLHPGEYMCQGELRNLITESYTNKATSKDSETFLDLDIGGKGVNDINKAEINFLSTGVYARTAGAYSMIASPKDHGRAITDPYVHIGYEWPTTYDYINVNNYIQNLLTNVSKFKATGIAPSVWDFDDSSIPYLCEDIGYANGTYNQVFKTKYFPISQPATDLSNSMLSGLTRVFTYHEGVLTQWKCYESYYEAQISGDANCCYLDRWNGKFYFVESNALETGFKEIGDLVYNGFTGTSFEKISDVGTGEFKFTIREALADQLLDSGFLQIQIEQYVPDPPVIETVSYRRVNKTTFIVRDYEAGWHGSIPIKIKPIIGNMTPPLGKVYVYYNVVIDFCIENNDNAKTPLSREIKPWFWSDQKAIAVLQTSKDLPYKISLKALDIPFAGQTGSTTSYGPIYSGSEIVLLEGTVTAEDGTPVPEQDVEILVREGFGNFSGERTAYVTTDSEGKFYESYNPNSSRENWIYFKDNQIVRGATGTKLIINESYNDLSSIVINKSESQDVIIYALMTNDSTLGTYGKTKRISSADVTGTTLADKYGKIVDITETRIARLGDRAIIVHDFLTDEDMGIYQGGTVTIKAFYSGAPSGDPTYVKLKIKDITLYPEAWYSDITEQYEFAENRHRINTYAIVIDNADTTYTGMIGNFTSVSLLAKNEKEFNPAKLAMGKKAALAEVKDPAIWKHPSIEGRTPVYGPVLTSNYDAQNKIFFTNQILPDSNSADVEKNIAGYALIPKTVNTIYARTFNEDSVYIESNNVLFNIELDQKDLGVATNILKTVKIPFGFRLVDNNDDSSSTININTFLTLNHVPGVSFNSIKYPTISALGPDGIIYLENSTYTASSDSLKFKITIDS